MSADPNKIVAVPDSDRLDELALAATLGFTSPPIRLRLQTLPVVPGGVFSGQQHGRDPDSDWRGYKGRMR